MSPGSDTAEELIDTLSAPRASSASTSFSLEMPPPTVNGMSMARAHAFHPTGHRPAAVSTGRNVQKHQFVRAFDTVTRSQFHDIARIAQPDEIRSLYRAPVLDIQTGYDPFCQHCFSSRFCKTLLRTLPPAFGNAPNTSRAIRPS